MDYSINDLAEFLGFGGYVVAMYLFAILTSKLLYRYIRVREGQSEQDAAVFTFLWTFLAPITVPVFVVVIIFVRGVAYPLHAWWTQD